MLITANSDPQHDDDETARTYTHTHTCIHTHIYIYIYIYTSTKLERGTTNTDRLTAKLNAVLKCRFMSRDWRTLRQLTRA